MNRLLGVPNEQPQRIPPQRIEVDPNVGLNAEQVLERTERGFANIPVEPPTKTVKQIILSNIFTYFNLIFFVLAIALIAVGSFNDLLFLPVVAANILIGTVQEINAKRTLDKLNLLNAPTARVIRGGGEMDIPVDQLVIDDIVVFGTGSQIPADAILLDGEVSVNESMITGEPDEIKKHPGDPLTSGSFVVNGSCRARLDKVGEDSFVSRLTLDAKRGKKKEQVGMMRSLTRLIACIGILLIPIGIAMMIRSVSHMELSVKDSVVSTAAALIGMIPEGLYLLVSVALAVSVIRLAHRKTLVHEMKCIETLARVDVLCVDKTGTITENEMKVTDLVPLKSDEAVMRRILADITGSVPAENHTMEALKREFGQANFRMADAVVPFTSATKYSGAVFDRGESYVVGAPEFIFRQNYAMYREKIEQYANQGKRVLALGQLSAPLTGGPLHDEVLPMGLVCLANRIRPEARETFDYFARQKVAVKVISGDNPLTVSRVAAEAGIPGAENYVDAAQLDTTEKLVEAANSCTVFGRVTPDQKRKLIRAMKAAGHTVAMTGDGVNDVLALKEADCSIAMASGSEVAAQVSQLVLLDSNFASMPAVVDEGRRVINNIERAAALFLVKNIFSFIMAWITIFAAFTYPIQAAQISFISLLTIGIPSFFLALEPNHNRVRGRFLTNVMYRALPAGLTNVIVVLAAVLYAVVFEIDNVTLSTVSALLMAVVGFVMLWRVCRPFTKMRTVLYIGLLTAFVVGYVLLGEMFSLEELNARGWVTLITLSLMVQPTMKLLTEGFDHLITGIRRLAARILSHESVVEANKNQ